MERGIVNLPWRTETTYKMATASASTSSIGKLPEYNQHEDWEDYCERLNSYFDVNSVAEGKKTGILLTLVDASTYRLMKDLAFPRKPSEKTYKDLIELVQKHKSPGRNEIVERYKFHSAQRQEGETVNAFLSRLKHMAEHCNFGNQLEINLRDRFVTGIQDDHMLRRMFGEGNPSLSTAITICLTMEQASENAALLASSNSASHVNYVKGKKRGLSNRNQHNSSQPKSQRSQPAHFKGQCNRCGENHDPQTCKWIKAKCRFCSKRGHIEAVCWKKRNGSTPTSRASNTYKTSVEENSDSECENERSGNYGMMHVEEIKRINDAIKVDMELNDSKLTMEIDTGASRSIIGEKDWEKVNAKMKRSLKPFSNKLKSFTGEIIPVIGEGKVEVKYGNSVYGFMPVIVAKGAVPQLLGRDWLKKVKLNWNEIFKVSSCLLSNPKPISPQLPSPKAKSRLEVLLDTYREVFKDELGTFTGGKASIKLKPGAQPIFLRARSVPFAILDDVEKELSKMVEQGILEPVRHSQYATPIVPVTHPNKTIRICGDYRATVNKITLPDPYPVPDIKQLLAKLGGGKWYCKLDLRKAFLQLQLDEESQELCCLNTHKGLMKMLRLPFGCSQAPGIFQRTIESLLGDIPRTVTFVDEILTTGNSEEDCLNQLEAILKRLADSGMRVNKEKCKWLVKELEYVGYRISETGIHPLEKKVSAIQNAPEPEDLSQLRAWLGLFNYYSKFLPRTADVLAPLYKLLNKTVKWKWGSEEQEAFQGAKNLLNSNRLLVHFDPAKPIVLNCDASPYGVSCILSHQFEDGSDRPIQCASRRLNKAEMNYSQTEREGLSVIFGITKFHQWLWGRKFQIITDHQPLLRLFSEKKETAKLAASRLVRWSIQLSAYNYEMIYRPGSKHQNCDALSRLPASPAPREVPIPSDTVHLMRCLEEGSSLTFSRIEKASRRDPVIGSVLVKLRTGWSGSPESLEEGTFYSRRYELGTQGDCLMWGSRVVIPKSLRKEALEILHSIHQGMSRTKQLARSYLWWPGMDRDIEDLINSCSSCQLQSKMPPAAPIHPWHPTQKPWSRIHIDHAGPFMGKLFLVIVDSYSKWVEIAIVPSTSAKCNIKVLTNCFSRFGLPDMIVSDNGTGFTSHEFQKFCSQNGVKHVKISPRHPRSNGLAEKTVQMLKSACKKNDHPDLEIRLAKILFAYRVTPHCTTGKAPCEMLQGRKLKTNLDLMFPANALPEPPLAEPRSFEVGDKVLVRDLNRWSPAVVERKTGPLSYRLRRDGGKEELRRHVDHLKTRKFEATEKDPDFDDLPGNVSAEQKSVSFPSPISPTTTTSSPDISPVRRYPSRTRKPPVRYSS